MRKPGQEPQHQASGEWRISINGNLDICFPLVVMSNRANICQTFQPRLQNTKSYFDVILRSHSENYSFDVVKFAYLTMPRITQWCWPYSIIYALIILPRNSFQPHSLLSSSSRHRLSVGSGSGKSMKQSISSPAISDIVKTKVGHTGHGGWYYYANVLPGALSSQPIC